MKIFLGTKNKNKIKEISDILAGANVRLLTAEDTGEPPDVEETGSTFEENARIKAMAFAKFAAEKTGDDSIHAIADDSGLEIEALGGLPGVMSARYAENNEQRIKRVLYELNDKLRNSQGKNRNARFVCVIALAIKEKLIADFRGTVSGKIIDKPRGTNGFGYDPIFVPDDYDKTFAELTPEIKNQLSHRANALKKFLDFIKTYSLNT